MVLATHDRDTIQRIGRRVLTLDRGRLVADQTIEGLEPPDLAPREPVSDAQEMPEQAIRELEADASDEPGPPADTPADTLIDTPSDAPADTPAEEPP